MKFPFARRMTLTVCLALLVMALASFTRSDEKPVFEPKTSYGFVLSQIKAGNVTRAEIREGGQVLIQLDSKSELVKAPAPTREKGSKTPIGQLDDALKAGKKLSKKPIVVAQYPYAGSAALVDTLAEAKVDFTTVRAEGPGASQRVLDLLPLILFLAIAGLMAYPLLKGRGLTGPKQKPLSEKPDVTFDDVAGHDEAISELMEIAEGLSSQENFERVGAQTPNGILLEGPPGTGKTLLAKALAGTAGIPFIAAAGSDFTTMWSGSGAANVRNLFAQARKHERAIVFIDEIDAVGSKRHSGPSGDDRDRNQTIVALLAEMDGFATTPGVIVIAATNRASDLDPALVRPGRLQRHITVSLPDRRGREAILGVHTRNRPLADDVDLVAVSHRTPGMSGADLEAVVNAAALAAARTGAAAINAEHFDSAVADTALGAERKSAVVSAEDRLLTAWHEAGHTCAALLLADAPDPVSVSIIPRKHAGGVTWMSGSDDLYMSRKQALAQLQVSLAGRAAEMIHLNGDFTTGAASDLAHASRLAMAMETSYGMGETGLLTFDETTVKMGGPVSSSAHKAAEANLQQALFEARGLLRSNLSLVEAVVSELIAEDTVPGARLAELYEQHQAACPAGDAVR